jgi:hypothetical protein
MCRRFGRNSPDKKATASASRKTKLRRKKNRGAGRVVSCRATVHVDVGTNQVTALVMCKSPKSNNCAEAFAAVTEHAPFNEIAKHSFCPGKPR